MTNTNNTNDEMKFANQYGWSDVYPHEIIRRVTAKAIEIRAMIAELDPAWKPEIVAGGFAGHCTNNRSQSWIIKSDKSNDIVRIRLHKDGTWRDKGGSKYRLDTHAIKFHDYNF